MVMATPAVSTASSPTSDQRFWSGLRNRVDSLLEDGRTAKLPAGVAESESGKRLREDSLLLIRGFDSVSSSLSQLTSILNSAARGVRQLAEPPLTDVLLKRQIQAEGEDEEDEDGGPKRKKRNCAGSISVADGREEKGAHGHEEKTGQKEEHNKQMTVVDGTTREEKLEKAKTLAITMATKASSLVRELRTIKSELCFMRDRCALLEEENKRLRGLDPPGLLLPEEDDLVRLQLETLLAEKSRLANENATLRRENQGLHQLVEYHQLTSQELSASYEEAIQGMFLDFSSCADDDGNGELAEERAPCTPRALLSGFSSAFEDGSSLDRGDLS